MVVIHIVRLEELRAMFLARRAAMSVADLECGEMLTDAIDEIHAQTIDARLAHDAKVEAWRASLGAIAS